MTTQIESSLSSFAEWVQATDDHATYRLLLLGRAVRLLCGEQHAPATDRRQLAAKIERWRYQHLNERRGHMAPEDCGLVDALDLAANDLAGRDPRPPRSVRD